jgi:steroid delta-isomerase
MIEVVEAYIDAFARGDAAAATALFADDATVEDPVGSPVRRGVDAIGEFYAASMATGARLQLTGPVRTAAKHAAFSFDVRLTYEGKSLRIEVIDTFRFNDAGQIVEMRAFFGPTNMHPG